jgi:hypothetical protein
MKKIMFMLSIIIAVIFGFGVGVGIKKTETIFVHKLGCPNGRCVVYDDISSIVKHLDAINHIVEEKNNEGLRYDIKHRTNMINMIINNSN